MEYKYISLHVHFNSYVSTSKVPDRIDLQQTKENEHLGNSKTITNNYFKIYNNKNI